MKHQIQATTTTGPQDSVIIDTLLLQNEEKDISISFNREYAFNTANRNQYRGSLFYTVRFNAENDKSKTLLMPMTELNYLVPGSTTRDQRELLHTSVCGAFTIVSAKMIVRKLMDNLVASNKLYHAMLLADFGLLDNDYTTSIDVNQNLGYGDIPKQGHFRVKYQVKDGLVRVMRRTLITQVDQNTRVSQILTEQQFNSYLNPRGWGQTLEQDMERTTVYGQAVEPVGFPPVRVWGETTTEYDRRGSQPHQGNGGYAIGYGFNAPQPVVQPVNNREMLMSIVGWLLVNGDKEPVNYYTKPVDDLPDSIMLTEMVSAFNAIGGVQCPDPNLIVTILKEMNFNASIGDIGPYQVIIYKNVIVFLTHLIK